MDLTGTKVTDRGLKTVGKLAGLSHLELDAAEISDAGLEHLTALPIEWLSVSGTHVTDAGLAHLTKLKRLATLQAGRRPVPSFAVVNTPQGMESRPNIPPDQNAETQVTDAGLKHLATIVTLRSLDLRGANISDDGLKQLRSALVKLKSLSLEGTPITDAGVAHLAALDWARIAGLEATKLTDAGLVTIGKLPNLEMLTLNKTAITNAGLPQLTSLKKLATLWLNETQVNREGGEKLLKAIRTLRTLDYPGNTALDRSGRRFPLH